jgi:hypothetical protein
MDADGTPLANLTVRVGAQSATSGSDGRFALTNVSTPYDLHVLQPDNTVDSYIGLTLRSLPDMILSVNALASVHVQVTGTISGASLPAPGRLVTVQFCAQGNCVGTAAAADGSYSLTGDLPAHATSGTLIALESTRGAASVPTAWGQYAVEQGIAIAPFANLTRNLALGGTLGTRTISGTLSAPTPFDPVNLAFTLSDGTGAASLYGENLPAVAQGVPLAAVLLPTVPGFTLSYSAVSSPSGPSVSRETAPVPAGDLAIALDPVFSLIAPAPQAAGITATTDFTWTALSSPAVYRLIVACDSMSRRVITAQPTARLVAFDTHPLVSGSSCQWRVTSISPLASVDARLQVLPALRRDSGSSGLLHFTVQ